MELVIFIGLILALTVLPIMGAGRLLGARRTGFGICVLAVVGVLAGRILSEKVAQDLALTLLLDLGLAAIVISVLLGVRYLRSLVIAALSLACQFLLAVLLIPFGFFGAALSAWLSI